MPGWLKLIAPKFPTSPAVIWTLFPLVFVGIGIGVIAVVPSGLNALTDVSVNVKTSPVSGVLPLTIFFTGICFVTCVFVTVIFLLVAVLLTVSGE